MEDAGQREEPQYVWPRVSWARMRAGLRAACKGYTRRQTAFRYQDGGRSRTWFRYHQPIQEQDSRSKQGVKLATAPSVRERMLFLWCGHARSLSVSNGDWAELGFHVIAPRALMTAYEDKLLDGPRTRVAMEAQAEDMVRWLCALVSPPESSVSSPEVDQQPCPSTWFLERVLQERTTHANSWSGVRPSYPSALVVFLGFSMRDHWDDWFLNEILCHHVQPEMVALARVLAAARNADMDKVQQFASALGHDVLRCEPVPRCELALHTICGGSLDILRWAEDTYGELRPYVEANLTAGLAFGHVAFTEAILAWFDDPAKNRPLQSKTTLTTRLIRDAAGAGHLQLLSTTARARSNTTGGHVLAAAAVHGHLDCVQHLVQRWDCLWGPVVPEMVAAAAPHNALQIIEVFVSTGLYELEPTITIRAAGARCVHLDLLRFISSRLSAIWWTCGTVNTFKHEPTVSDLLEEVRESAPHIPG